MLKAFMPKARAYRRVANREQYIFAYAEGGGRFVAVCNGGKIVYAD
jgi:hypothetical protein